MTNQLQAYKGMEFGALTTQDVATIKETVAKGANDSQFRFFMATAKASGANPLTNEIYATVRQGQLTIQYGYDFYVRKAKESEGYLGYDVQLVHENDKVNVARKTDEHGRSYMVVDKHDISFPRGKVIAAYAIAFREGVSPFVVFMEREEVSHLERSNIGMQKTMWTNYFGDMFKKHVLRRALKGQFGLEFDDQTVGNESTPEYKPARKDITPNEPELDTPAPNTPAQDEVRDETKIEKLRRQTKEAFETLGITTNEAITEYLNKNKVKLSDPATEQEMTGLLEMLETNIELEKVKQEAEQADDDDLL